MTKGSRDHDQHGNILNHSVSGLLPIKESEVKSIKIFKKEEEEEEEPSLTATRYTLAG